jgi:hypothetical protein
MILAPVVLVLQVHAAVSGGWCPDRPPDSSSIIFAYTAPSTSRDTLLRASVCYRSRSSLQPLGSFHGKLHFDSTKATVVKAEDLVGGSRAVNVARKGLVDFAGASSQGFSNGPLVAVFLKVRAGYRPAVRLQMFEATSLSGTKLLPSAVARPSTPVDSSRLSSGSCSTPSSAGANPILVRLLPDVVPLDSLQRGAVVKIEIQGCRFDRAHNIVRLAGSSVAEVPSASDETRIVFSLPVQLNTGGEVAPRRLGPGSYSLSVVTPAGTSNSLTLVVR